jgi:CarboxypepD_reg-like domain
MSLIKFVFIALIAVIGISFFEATAQNPDVSVLSGRVTDTQKRPLAYVSIGVVNTSTGTVSDEKGEYVLYLQTTQTEVLFSMIGYKSVKISIEALRQNKGLVVMQEQVQQLAEVTITNRELKTKVIGSNDIKTNSSTNFAISGKPRQNLGAEIGRKFNLPNRPTRLLKYRVYVNCGFEEATFRVNVYSHKDFSNLLNNNIYCTAKKGKNWIEIDLTPYDILTNENVVVSLQWVAVTGSKGWLQLPITMPATAIHYYKYGSQDQWKKFVGMTTAMNLTVEY